MATTLSCGLVFYGCYFHMPFLLMNHSCWLIDMALIAAKRLNDDLQPIDDQTSESTERTNEQLRELTMRCEKFIEWQKDAQDLVKWHVSVEFQLQIFVFCFSIYVLSFYLFDSRLILAILVFCLLRVFALCWMGTRVASRLDQLSYESSKDWYLMRPKERKTLRMILHEIQNMKGFSGLFKDVSLKTFKSVKKITFFFKICQILIKIFLRFWKLLIHFMLS